LKFEDSRLKDGCPHPALGRRTAAWGHAACKGELPVPSSQRFPEASCQMRKGWDGRGYSCGYKCMHPLRTDRYGWACALLESSRVCVGCERIIQSTT